LALELQRLLLEAIPQRRAIALLILWMHAMVPILRTESGSLKTENLHQAGRDKE
jgi:hypothetical protein